MFMDHRRRELSRVGKSANDCAQLVRGVEGEGQLFVKCGKGNALKPFLVGDEDQGVTRQHGAPCVLPLGSNMRAKPLRPAGG